MNKVVVAVVNGAARMSRAEISVEAFSIIVCLLSD